jgi:cytochrome c peroxidase
MTLGTKDSASYFVATVVLFTCGTLTILAQNPGPPPPPQGPQNPRSLKTVPLPQFTNSEKYIKDQNALVILGKALFWDMQTGSDGRTACGSCHFHAGADHRVQNQVSNSVAAFLANQTLSGDNFPFHLLSNTNDNRSTVARDRADVAGSQGMFRRMFVDIVTGTAAENGVDAFDRAAFTIAGVNVRQVTTRNAPPVINAVFNYRNFWDGRASNIFSGSTPFGPSDPGMNSLAASNGQLTPELVRVENSSLASQAMGPAANDTEMAYSGRNWPKLGKKMLSLAPLAKQRVAPDDSVLGLMASLAGPGLLPQYTYRTLVQSAFQPAYWNSDQLVDVTGSPLAGRKGEAASTSEFTQAEFNFPLFWGLAIQAYEATLVSDNSSFDQFAEGNAQALTAQEQTGLNLFRRNDCDNCHSGAEFTAASLTSVLRLGATGRGPNGGGRLDTGFFRTGVRPIADDIGLGGVDVFGTPFSIAPQQSAAVNGAFKSPTLRNVEFSGPYFHNGGQATLEQVVDFYSRGGDFPAGGTGPGIRPLNLSTDNRAALTAFLKTLSDDRVRFERAPFDHPELCVPTGSDTAQPSLGPSFPLSAADKWAGVPSVGASGSAVPLQTFDELLQGIGLDGSRAHTLSDACLIP